MAESHAVHQADQVAAYAVDPEHEPAGTPGARIGNRKVNLGRRRHALAGQRRVGFDGFPGVAAGLARFGCLRSHGQHLAGQVHHLAPAPLLDGFVQFHDRALIHFAALGQMHFEIVESRLWRRQELADAFHGLQRHGEFAHIGRLARQQPAAGDVIVRLNLSRPNAAIAQARYGLGRPAGPAGFQGRLHFG